MVCCISHYKNMTIKIAIKNKIKFYTNKIKRLVKFIARKLKFMKEPLKFIPPPNDNKIRLNL